MRCQWIPPEIDPALLSDAELDRVHCGRPTSDRHCPWCAEHLARVFKQDGMSDEAVTAEPVEPVEPEPIEEDGEAA